MKMVESYNPGAASKQNGAGFSALILDGAILAAVVCAFYRIYLSSSEVSPSADLVNLFLPMKTFTRQAFSQGVVPLWNPYLFCGSPFLATMQAAVLYPFNLPAIVFDNPALGMNLYRLLHLWWMAFGVCCYLRVCERAPRAIAIGCSLALPCGAHLSTHLDHVNQLAVIAWFPWWMMATWFCLRRPSARVAAAMGLCGAMQWLAGHPQHVTFTLLLTAAYLVGGTLFGHERRQRNIGRIWLCAIAGAALAAALGFAQVLPTMELGKYSLRVFDDTGLKTSWPPGPDVGAQRYSARFAFHPKFLILGILPNAYGNPRDGYHIPEDARASGASLPESRHYVGLLILSGAAVGAALALRRRWREHLFWLGAIIAAYVFAMGDATPFHWLVSALLPPLKHFRAPPRVLFVAAFALSILAASGWRLFDEWLRRSVPAHAGWIPAAVLWCLAAATVVDLRLVFNTSHAANPVDARALAAPGYWASLSERSQGYRVFRLMPNDGDATMDNLAQGVAERMKRLQPDNPMNGGISLVDGYEEGLLPLARTLEFSRRYFRNFYRPAPDEALLALMNVRYVMAELPVSSPLLAEDSELRMRGAQSEYRFYRNGVALPQVVPAQPVREAVDLSALDGEWFQSDGARRGTLNRERADEDYMRLGWLREDERRGAAMDKTRSYFNALGAGVSVETPDCNRIELTASGPVPGGEMLLLQTPYPGWRLARRSGEPEELKPECAIASSFRLGSETRATLVFRPWSFRLGLFVSLIGWSVMIGICVAAPRRAERLVTHE